MTTAQIPLHILPKGTKPLETQVAGHTFQAETDSIGILKDENDGSVLKSLPNPICREREKLFYQCLQNRTTQSFNLLRQLVPEFRGIVKLKFKDREVEFIKLADITHGLVEPCIMDIKIGKRTWDPLATPEKIRSQEERYTECKKKLGVCIPGFQVYHIKTGKLLRFGKNYGRNLKAENFKETLKIFLNGDTKLCPILVEQILTQLRNCRKWLLTQVDYNLYSSSLLIVYDAKRLKEILQLNGSNTNMLSSFLNYNLLSSNTEITKWLHANDVTIYNPKETLNGFKANTKNSFDMDGKTNSDLKLKNYNWIIVKMIDFAHAFPNEDSSIDSNYLFGIEKLIELFEELKEECT